jgi:hypothetical protein
VARSKEYQKERKAKPVDIDNYVVGFAMMVGALFVIFKKW